MPLYQENKIGCSNVPICVIRWTIFSVQMPVYSLITKLTQRNKCKLELLTCSFEWYHNTSVLLLFPWARNFIYNDPVHPAELWGPGDLSNINVVPHRSKCQLSISHTVGKDQGYTLGAQYSLASGELSGADSWHLSRGSLSRHEH